MQGPRAHRAASSGWVLPVLQGPPSPLPPSLFPRVGRGGEQDWPAESGKNQGVSFPQEGPRPHALSWPWDGGTGISVQGRPRNPTQAVLLGQSTAGERWVPGEGLRELLESFDALPLPQAQPLDVSLDPTVSEDSKAEGEGG